jgi:hypothetical protein
MTTAVTEKPPAVRRRGRAVLVIVGLAVLTILWSVSPGFRHEVALSFTKEPAPFTELYFTDVTRLPKHLPAGATSVEVPFTIASHERAPVDYRWQVQLDDGITTSVAATGTTSVRPGSSGLVSAEVPGLRAGHLYRVTVSLEGRPEQLHLEVGP